MPLCQQPRGGGVLAPSMCIWVYVCVCACVFLQQDRCRAPSCFPLLTLNRHTNLHLSTSRDLWFYIEMSLCPDNLTWTQSLQGPLQLVCWISLKDILPRYIHFAKPTSKQRQWNWRGQRPTEVLMWSGSTRELQCKLSEEVEIRDKRCAEFIGAWSADGASRGRWNQCEPGNFCPCAIWNQVTLINMKRNGGNSPRQSYLGWYPSSHSWSDIRLGLYVFFDFSPFNPICLLETVKIASLSQNTFRCF